MFKFGAWSVAPLAVVLLSGCHPQPVSPVSKIVPGHIKMTLAANRLDTLTKAFEVHPDCTTAGLAQIRILGEPLHGTTQTAQISDFPNYPMSNSRYVCNKNKMPGVNVTYTPEPGYVGPDSILIELVSPEGQSAKLTYDVTVQ